MSKVLYDTLDYFTANLKSVAWREQPANIRAGIALLDKHALWKPRGSDAKHASAAIVEALIRTIYNLFGDASNDGGMFRKADKQCGAQCARFVTAFALQKHRLVKEFWTHSIHGLARPVA
jgi:hypothetical protein